MSNQSKRSLMQRIMSAIIAFFFAISCALDYIPVIDNVFSNDTLSVVHAKDTYDSTTVFDAGEVKLAGYNSDGSQANPWLCLGMDSYAAENTYTVKETVVNRGDSLNFMMCYSTYLGEEDDSAPGRGVTDYLAPRPPKEGKDYYYIAKGTVSTSGTTKNVDWQVFAWPKGSGYSDNNMPPTLTTQAKIHDEWYALIEDYEKDKAGYTVTTAVPRDEKTKTEYKSEFGWARPRWESGNVFYKAWLGDSTGNPDEEGAVVTAATVGHNKILNGDNLVWWSSDDGNTPTADTARPWCQFHFPDTIVKGDDSDDHVVATIYPHCGVDNGILGLSSHKYYYGSDGETSVSDTGKQRPIIDVKTSSAYRTTVGSGDLECYDLLHILYDAYNESIYSYSDIPRDDEIVDTVRGADKVRIMSAQDQIVSYWKSHSATSVIGTANKEPVGYRLYGLWAEGGDPGNPRMYTRVFSEYSLINSLNKLKSNPDTEPSKTSLFYRLTHNGNTPVSAVNVSPVYDVTFEYQRAAGDAKGIIPSSDETIVSTTAVDEVTGDHTGYCDSSSTIIDSVVLDGLDTSVDYTLNADVYKIDSTGSTTVGPIASNTKSFKPNKSNITVEMSIPGIDTSDDPGSTYVVFENLVVVTTPTEGDPVEVLKASHENIDDIDQQVKYIDTTSGVSIDYSTALDTHTETHYGLAANKSSIKDTVHITGLTIGKTYTVKAELYDITDMTRIPDGPSRTYEEIPQTYLDATLDFTGTFNSEGKDGHKLVVYDYLYEGDTLIASHEDVNDAQQTVYYKSVSEWDKAHITSTEAVDQMTQCHVARALNGAVIEDTVNYTDATPDAVYIIKGHLYLINDDGDTISIGSESTVRFTATSTSGSRKVTFGIDEETAKLVAGHKVVAYEELYRKEADDDALSAHPAKKEYDADEEKEIFVVDPVDEDQMVYFPSISTELQDKSIETVESFDLVDKVHLENLVTGKTYRLVGTIMDAESASPMMFNGSPVRTVHDFVASTANQDENVTFDDVNLMCEGVDWEKQSSGHKDYVVFQDLYYLEGTSQVKLITADDISDENETIEITKPTVTTTLKNKADGFQTIKPSTETTLVDHVQYKGLQTKPIGSTTDVVYKTVLTLHDDEGNQLTNKNGSPLRLERELRNPAYSDLDVDLEITFNSIPFTNKRVLAYNELYRILNGNEYLVCSETDRSDILDKGNQVVSFPGDYALSTSAKLTGSDDVREAMITDTLSITDSVRVSGISLSENYCLKTSLWDKTEGELVPFGNSSSSSESGSTNDDGSYTVKTDIVPTDMDMIVNTRLDNIDISSRVGHTLVVFESLEDKETGEVYAEHKNENANLQSITVVEPEIKTNAKDKESGTKVLPCLQEAVIVDTVTYKGLTAGKSYSLIPGLKDKTTGKDIPVNVVGGSAYRAFIPKKNNGTVDVEIQVDSLALAGREVVVTEDLVFGSNGLIDNQDSNDGSIVARHNDLKDKDQTVTVEKPELTTVATYGEKAVHTLPCAGDVPINDAVTMKNLRPGVSYTLKAYVYDKSTAKRIKSKYAVYGSADADMPDATLEFKAESSTETRNVQWVYDTCYYPGKTIVIFEELYSGDVKIAEHCDIKDDSQTLVIKKPSIDTVATCDETGTHQIPFSSKVNVTDTVSYKNLEPDRSYVLYMGLYDADTGKELTQTKKKKSSSKKKKNSDDDDDDEEEVEISSSIDFTPEHKNGSESISVDFTAIPFVGRNIVCYEYLYCDGACVAKHVDRHDSDQRVEVVRPELVTEATDTYNGTHTVAEPVQNAMLSGVMSSGVDSEGNSYTSTSDASQSASISDRVSYAGLAKGESYTLTTRLIDKATGEEVSPKGDTASSSTSTSSTISTGGTTTTFTATGWSGKVTVPINVDINSLMGKTLVVFQEISSGQTVGATHADLGDAAQTVYIGALATTLEGTGKGGKKEVPASSKLSLVDKVAYFGLEPGVTYTINGQIMNYDAVTGQVAQGSTLGGLFDDVDDFSIVAGESRASSDSGPVMGSFSMVDNSSDEISLGTSDSSSTKSSTTSSSSSKSSTTSSSSSKTGTTSNSSSKTGSGSSSVGVGSGSGSTKPATTGSGGVIGIAGGTSSDSNSNQSSGSSDSSEPLLPTGNGNNGSDNTDGDYDINLDGPKTTVYGDNMAMEVGSFSMTFVPEQTSGIVEVPFVVDASRLQQHKLVAYETVYKGKKAILGHTNINDPNQTVRVGTASGTSWRTGIESNAKLFAMIAMILLGIATCIVGVLALRKRFGE